ETADSSPPSSDPEQGNKLFIAEANDKIVPGSYVAIQKGSAIPAVFQVTAVQERPRTAYGLSAETTELTFGDDRWAPASDDFHLLRTSTVYAESELLELAPLPIEDEIRQESADDSEIPDRKSTRLNS